MTAVAAAGVEEFSDAVTAMDPAAGRAVVRRMLADGADPLGVIDQVIVPSQHQVGLRWQRAEWTVSRQHAATQVAMAAAEAVRQHLAPLPRRRGHVVLACAEREWHALPITLIALAFRTAGWETTVLGAGVSSLRLSRYLHELGPDATAISGSVLSSLPTSRRFVEASSAAGVPTVVGGAAFGLDARRADALGATAWASSARGAVHALDGLPLAVRPVAPLPRELAGELAALREQHSSMRLEIAARWQPFGARLAAGRRPDSPAEVVRTCIDQGLHAVAAAVLTEDPSVLAATRAWTGAVLSARGDEQSAAHAAELAGLLATMLREYPWADALLSER
ncbi:MAG: B12-binding domain-containing protein [Jatrophihabitantaceae bacterium]